MAQENQSKKKRGRSSGNSVLLILVLIIVGAIAAVATVMIVNDGKLFGSSTPQVARVEGADENGKIPVPISVRGIDAYAAVQNEDLIDPKVKDFAVVKVDAAKAKAQGFVTDITQIRGRVMGRDKLPGYAFV